MNNSKHLKLALGIVFSFVLAACDKQAENNQIDEQVFEQQTSEKKEPRGEPQNISVIDFSGKTVSLDSPARRIVALAPHIVENVYSAGAGEYLVGVVSYSDYPEEALKLPIVGGYAKTNLEKILELEPDLVIAWESGNSDNSVARIQELGFTVYIDQPDNLDGVAKSVRDIGLLAGTHEIADTVANDYLAKVNEIRQLELHTQPVTTFYQVWNSPLRTINGGHIISDAIELCGGVNIYAEQTAISPIINIESILERNPEVILASGMSDARPDWLDDWDKWPSLTAVQRDNLYFVDPDHIQRHTLRILFGLEKICEKLETARSKRKTPNQN